MSPRPGPGQLQTVQRPPEGPGGGNFALHVSQIIRLLTGIASASYCGDKRLLDAQSQINIGNTAILNVPNAVATAVPFPGQPFSSGTAQTTIFEARARNERSPEVFTLFIGPAAVSFEGGAISPDIRARIEWGAGGASHIADVDCQANGAVVTLSGTFVRVVGLVTRLSAGTINPPSLGASASYGPHPHPGPTWSNFELAVAAGVSSQEFLVPPWARSVTVFAVDPATGTSQAVHVRILGMIINNFDQPPNIVQTIPLSGQDIEIVLDNPNLIAIDVSLTFHLSL